MASLLEFDTVKAVYLTGSKLPELISPDNWNSFSTVDSDGKNHDLVSDPFGHGKKAPVRIKSDVGIARSPAVHQEKTSSFLSAANEAFGI